MEEQAPIAAPAAVLAVLQGVEDELAPNPPAPNAPALVGFSVVMSFSLVLRSLVLR